MYSTNSVAIAAILRQESAFVEEWIAYHRLLGVDHLLLYDDDFHLPLEELLKHHMAYTTVVNWYGAHGRFPSRNRQTAAYSHAFKNTECEWIAFIDIDEFIVLRKHESIKHFLREFDNADQILLDWHIFGHNGFFDDPVGLITEQLTRRRLAPGRMAKCIARRAAIRRISSAHVCEVSRPGTTYDANNVRYKGTSYEGKTDVANINHYLCRSFVNWMGRVRRGEVAFTAHTVPRDQMWRYDELECLRKFVELSRDFNEHIDLHMLQYAQPIRTYLRSISNPESSRNCAELP